MKAYRRAQEYRDLGISHVGKPALPRRALVTHLLQLMEMNNRTKSFGLRLVRGLSIACAALISFATQSNGQSLGAAATFGVLGASTVTNSGASVIAGDVGVSPGSAITGFPPGIVINGDIHAADGPATQAHADFATAYNYYAGLPFPPANNLTDQDLGGMTLTPGIYHFNVAATSNGALTFDAQNDPDAVFVIQIGTTLITSGASTVILINGADARNVYFQLGTAATLGSGSSFKGNLMAGTAITAVGGVSVTGRLLALVEAVTLDTNTVHVAPVVRNTNDGGIDSLRQALALAEDGDTITFEIPKSDPGYLNNVWTIGLTTGELVVDKYVRISGPGANVLAVQRDLKAPAFRIFHVNAGVPIARTQRPQVQNQPGIIISGMTIRNGLADGIFPASAGGGIHNDHTNLTVTACALSANSAVSDTFAGGGIYNDGSNGSATLTVASSTLNENSASNGYGGGISNNGGGGSANLTVVNSTLSDNVTSQFGGAGIDSDTTGGTGLPVTVINCTLSGNSGGAGIVSFGDLFVGNTILKAGAAGPNIDFGSNVSSLGYNLSDDYGNGFLTGTGDQINRDPILGPLKDNGGTTLTHVPLSNSPALDQGQDMGRTDIGQRGRVRPVTYDLAKTIPVGGDRSDIGAVELAAGVQPISAAARKGHQASGELDISLPIFGTPGIESRSGGAAGDYQVVLNFAQPITLANAAITSGAGLVVGVGTNRPSRIEGGGITQVTVSLQGVLNLQTITVALFNVSDGKNSGDVGLRMGLLLGDANGSGTVDSGDTILTRSHSGEAATQANAPADVNADGFINSGDTTKVRAKSGSSLPLGTSAPRKGSVRARAISKG